MLLILAAAPSDVDGRTRLSGGPRMRAVITDAQDTCVELDFIPPPGGGEHTHHFTPHLAPGWGMVLYPEEYVRCGGVTFLGTIIPVDIDYCDGEGTCGLWNQEAYQGSEVVGWSDGGAGGLFGRIDPQFGFVEEQDPGLVTHYRAGVTPGIVALSALFDDLTEPPYDEFEEGILFADDEPSWSDPTEITVWDFVIDRPDVRPIYDQTLAFNISIRPTLDHYSNSMARKVAFTINNVSSEPGYCLNATVEDGVEWRRTTANDHDLKIDPDENEGMTFFGAPDYYMAWTDDELTDGTIIVRCLDYGAWGTVRAQVMGSFGGTQNPYARLDTTTVWQPVNEAHFPVDEDGTHIWDGWTVGGNPADGDPNDDNENTPVGAGRVGDGWSRYDEYRGFKVGAGWITTDPDVMKDLFIYRDSTPAAVQALGPGVLSTASFDLGYAIHEDLLEDQVQFTGDGGLLTRLRRFPSTHGGTNDYAVHLIRAFQEIAGVGGTGPPGHEVVAAGIFCLVAIGRIQEIPDWDPGMYEVVTAHELGHAVGIHPPSGAGQGHHDPDNPPTFRKGCIMDRVLQPGYTSEFCATDGPGDDVRCVAAHRLLPWPE